MNWNEVSHLFFVSVKVSLCSGWSRWQGKYLEPAMPKISCLDVEVMLSELPDGKANHVIKIVNFEVRHFSLTFSGHGILQSSSWVNRQDYKVLLSFCGNLVIGLYPCFPGLVKVWGCLPREGNNCNLPLPPRRWIFNRSKRNEIKWEIFVGIILYTLRFLAAIPQNGLYRKFSNGQLNLGYHQW